MDLGNQSVCACNVFFWCFVKTGPLELLPKEYLLKGGVASVEASPGHLILYLCNSPAGRTTRVIELISLIDSM